MQFETSPDVQDALDKGTAIVALESTIITHGMPYPQNLETARQVEQGGGIGGAGDADGSVHARAHTRWRVIHKGRAANPRFTRS